MVRPGAVSGGSSKLRVLACACVAGLGVSLPSIASAQVQWKSGAADDTERALGVDAAPKLAELVGRADRSRVVIRFNAPLTAAEKDRLEAKGVTLLNPLGENAYFARIEQGRTVAADVAGMAAFKSVSAIRPEWKLHRDLANGVIQPWTVIEQKVVEDADEGAKLEATVAVYVLFHKDVNLLRQGAGIIHDADGSIRSYIHSVNGAVVEMEFSKIRELAEIDEVQYIEPALPLFDELNAENRQITQVNTVNAAPYNLNGAGVMVMIYDGGMILNNHLDFGSRAIIGPSDTDGLSDHATHVAGTFGGDGTASAGVDAGMAPGVDIVSYGFEVPGGLMQGFLYTDPGDLEADYTEAMSLGAVISNNSIGSNTAPNGFPCEWEGDYGVTASLIDAIARGSLGAPFRIVWAAGNERQGTQRCGGSFGTTAPPSNAKNSITVGALNSDDDSITGFTSFGPSDDGRVRPVVSAPGCQISEDGGVRSAGSASPTSYTVKCGTSMASPTVTGISALILQDYRNQFPGAPEMLNSTLKVILAHTAVDLDNPGPDNRTGYGSVRAQDAVDFVRTGNFFEDSLSQGGSRGAIAIVNPGEELKVTLAWDDVPGTPNVVPSLVNDLDLVVTSPSGVRHFPWTMIPGDPGAPAVRTVVNTLDNIEQVFVENPEPGAWLVEVVGTDIPQGPQSFSLGVSPFLVNCTDAGNASFVGNEFTCMDTVTVRLSDCGLNTSDTVTDTADVTVSVDGGASINLTLTESAPESAEFSGTFVLGGDLSVVDGDTITVTYMDADDGMGMPGVSMDSASIDCVAPAVTSVTIVDINARDAVVTIETDEPSSVQVAYGEDCMNPALLATSASFATSHTLTLSGLQSDTSYAFSIALNDSAGNTGGDDNGGACYSFTTLDVPDFFTEHFDGGDNDTEGFITTFIPNGSIDFYDACTEPLGGLLPIDPTGGTILPLSDDDAELVQITGGASVSLYGQSYTSIWVSSNGYITFTASDTDTSESLADHFDTPRVAALFDDLNPGQQGDVSVLQLSDRIVVTYDNVTEFSNSNNNTFQIALGFDGTISIAWLNIDVSDGLAGLSAGNGLNPDFFESDIVGYGECGPRPPVAGSVSVTMNQGTHVEFDLISSDDGLPDPPASVSTVIMSLPNQPLVDPGTGSAISAFQLPYTLANGGRTVRYEPDFGFTGMETFQFLANDGGTAPEGGNSNIGTVSLTVEELFMLPFTDSFDSMMFNSSRWPNIDGATIDNSLAINPPSAPFSMKLNGDPDGTDEIVSALMDLSQATSATLSWWYQRTGSGNSPEAGEDLVVEFLDAQGAWIELDRKPGDGPDMSVFEEVIVALPSEAMHSSFRIRYRNTATGGEFDDWFVDDVLLEASLLCTADVDGSGVVDFNDLLGTVFLFGEMGGAGDADGSGVVDFNDLIFILFRFGPCM